MEHSFVAEGFLLRRIRTFEGFLHERTEFRRFNDAESLSNGVVVHFTFTANRDEGSASGLKNTAPKVNCLHGRQEVELIRSTVHLELTHSRLEVSHLPLHSQVGDVVFSRGQGELQSGHLLVASGKLTGTADIGVGHGK